MLDGQRNRGADRSRAKSRLDGLSDLRPRPELGRRVTLLPRLRDHDLERSIESLLDGRNGLTSGELADILARDRHADLDRLRTCVDRWRRRRRLRRWRIGGWRILGARPGGQEQRGDDPCQAERRKQTNTSLGPHAAECSHGPMGQSELPVTLTEQPRVVADDTVDAGRDDPLELLRVVDRPGEHRQSGRVGTSDGARTDDSMLERHRRRPGSAREPDDPVRQRQAHEPNDELDHGTEVGPARDRRPIRRIGQSQRQLRAGPTDDTEIGGDRRRHEDAIDEPVTNDRLDELVEARVELEIDVEPDTGSLLHEEVEHLVEGRQGGNQASQLVEGELRPVARSWRRA